MSEDGTGGGTEIISPRLKQPDTPRRRDDPVQRCRVAGSLDPELIPLILIDDSTTFIQDVHPESEAQAQLRSGINLIEITWMFLAGH